MQKIIIIDVLYTSAPGLACSKGEKGAEFGVSLHINMLKNVQDAINDYAFSSKIKNLRFVVNAGTTENIALLYRS